MDSGDSAGQSLICGGMKKFLIWLDMDFMKKLSDFSWFIQHFSNTI